MGRACGRSIVAATNVFLECPLPLCHSKVMVIIAFSQMKRKSVILNYSPLLHVWAVGRPECHASSICSGCRFQARSVFAVPMTVADSSDVARKLGIKHLRTLAFDMHKFASWAPNVSPTSPLSSITNGFKYYGVGIRTHLDDRWGSNRFAEGALKLAHR